MRATEIVKKKIFTIHFSALRERKTESKIRFMEPSRAKNLCKTNYTRLVLHFHLHPYQLFLYWLVNLYVLGFFKNQNVILDFILTAILQKRIGRPPLVIKEFIEEYDVDALLPDNAELLLKFIPTETEVRGYRFTKAGQGRIHNHGISLS